MERLYWKSDKERLNQILQRINNKYLVGLYEKLRDFNDQGQSRYDDDHTQSCSSVPVNYDGCRFTLSRKTIRKELVRRGLIRQKEIKDFTHPDGSPRKWGTKKYKNFFRVTTPKGWDVCICGKKSGKEMNDIRLRDGDR